MVNDPSASDFNHKMHPQIHSGGVPPEIPRSNKMLKTAYNRKSQQRDGS